ncbi:MAG: hypothetical protein DMF25_11125, partial [Verrucomicrobia bacterium]
MADCSTKFATLSPRQLTNAQKNFVLGKNPIRSLRSTSHYLGRRTSVVPCIRSRKCSTAASRFFAGWGLRWPMVPTSRP